MLDPVIVVPPLLWMVSDETDGISGCRVTANLWDAGNPAAATEGAGWGSAATNRPVNWSDTLYFKCTSLWTRS